MATDAVIMLNQAKVKRKCCESIFMDVKNNAKGGPLTDMLPPRKPLIKPAMENPLRSLCTLNRNPVRNRMERITKTTAQTVFNQNSCMYLSITVPKNTPIIPVNDNNRILLLSLSPFDRTIIWIDENKLNRVSNGIRVLIGIK